MNKSVFSRGLYGIFLAVFSLVFGKVLFGDTVHSYNTIVLLLILAGAAGLICLAHFFLARQADAIERYYRIILPVFLTVYCIASVVIGFSLRFTPAFDMDAVYGGAVQWVETSSFADYYEYYGYFPNNLGTMTVLHFVFSLAALVGISDYFAVGVVFNCLLLTAAAAVVSLTCRKLRGSVAGVLALVFFALCLPFLFMGAAFYTDSLSVLFPVLYYYLYLHYREQETWKRRGVYAAAMAAVLSVGMLIKFTVLIAFVAVLLDGLLNLHWKKICLIGVCSLFLASAAFGALHAYMYSVHLDREECRRIHTPYLHWVMMGLQNNGYYSAADYEYTRSFPPEERDRACLSRIGERVKAMGFYGLTDLWMNKIAACFGDGTYALSDFLDDSPKGRSWLHPYILYNGKKYKSYSHLTTGILLAVYFFMLAGAWRSLRRKGSSPGEEILAPRLACLGILAFLLFWETSGRYFTNFIPLMLVCAVLAFEGKKKEQDNV